MTVTGNLSHRSSSAGSARDLPLVDLLDRLVESGVSVSGDVVVSVAGIDLIYLGLRAVLKGVDGSAEDVIGEGSKASLPDKASTVCPCQPESITALSSTERSQLSMMPFRHGQGRDASDANAPGRHHGARRTAARIGMDPDHVERGLVQLVLTVVELVRQLLERQALRRVDAGTLHEDAIERLGYALLQLNERMEALKAEFGLSDEDINVALSAFGDVS